MFPLISGLPTKRQAGDPLLQLFLEVSRLVSVDEHLASVCKALASICREEEGREERKERGKEGKDLLKMDH